MAETVLQIPVYAAVSPSSLQTGWAMGLAGANVMVS